MLEFGYLEKYLLPPTSFNSVPLPHFLPLLPFQSFSPKHKHSQPLTCVYHNLGMVVTGSKDGSATVYSMGATPHCATTLEHHNSAITSVSESSHSWLLCG